MATTTSERATTERAAPVSAVARRLRLSDVVLAIWVGFALVTIVSGITGVVGGIPSALRLAFYVVTPLLIVCAGVLFWQRVRNYERGAPDRRATTSKNVGRRLRDFRAGMYMQTLLRDPAAGVMHSCIYFGFLTLFGVTTVFQIDHQMPESAKFLRGGVYQGFSAVGDAAGLVFLIGIVWAIGRRYLQRPYRIRIKTKPEHAVILTMFFVLAVTGFATETVRIALVGRPAFEKWSFIGYPLSALVNSASESTLDTWHQVLWCVHVASFLVFLLVLPITMLRHMFTSPLNMYLRDRDRPKGAMRAMPNLTETELETFGAATVEDFTWKQLLDTDACTMCGRCTSVCPAHATGKPLDPREIVLKSGEVMAATGQPVVPPPIVAERELSNALTRSMSSLPSPMFDSPITSGWRISITRAMTAATSSALCDSGKLRESGPPWRALRPKSVRTTPGETSDTVMPGCDTCSSARSVAVSALRKCFAPQ